MSITYSLSYFHPDGTAGDIGGIQSIAAAYGVNAVGEMVVTVPLPGTKPITYYRRFATAELYRVINGVSYLEGDRLWRLSSARMFYDTNRERYAELRFQDDNALLSSRIVTYYLGSAAGALSDEADDMMKTIVRENLGASASASRNNTKITVAANTSQATSVSWITGYGNLLTTLQDIQKLTLNTTPVFFDCVRTSSTTSEFRTYYGQRGANRGLSSAAPFLLTMEGGNLSEPSLTYDWRDEVNYVYGLGAGDGPNRDNQNYPSSYPADPMTLRESVLDCSNIPAGQTTALLNAAKAEYEKRITRPQFTAKLTDSNEVMYGRDYHYGDMLAVQFEGYSCNAMVSTVQVKVSSDGSVSTEIKVKNYE